MPFARIHSAQTDGLEARVVDIEIDLSRGLHSFSIVGLPGKAVEEARDRVGAALKNSGFSSPKHSNKKVVISLAPADLRKEGPSFDVGIALSYLLATEEISFNPKGRIFLGELALDGNIRPIKGALVLARSAQAAGFLELFLPQENAKEASLIEGIRVFGASSLREITEHLDEQRVARNAIVPTPHTEVRRSEPEVSVDFSDIIGQERSKRALQIAVAGRHNILLFGPPGTGKTMLAEASIGICPPLSFAESLETTAIHSVAGILREEIISTPPFRRPHHSSRAQALIGGGAIPKPGEITLAHNGILFLDEFPEFDKNVIDSLREPLEEGRIAVSRAKCTSVFPARFMLIAAMNPCPCGLFGTKERQCRCPALSLSKYQEKISGPVADRIDLWSEVSPVSPESHLQKKRPLSSLCIRKSIEDARAKQAARYQKHFKDERYRTNSDIPSKEIGEIVRLSPELGKILAQAGTKLRLSTRSHYKIIKIARTIADLANAEEIEKEHLFEAFGYRPREKR